MLTHLEDSLSIADAVARRQIVADGPGGLNESWLREGERVAMPEESGRHLEEDECSRLAAALHIAGVHELTAIANDPLVLDEIVYALTASAADLAVFSAKFGGINALLLPRIGTDLAVLFSTDDYHLVAGPRGFVTSYVGNVEDARNRFLTFVEGHFEMMQPLLRKITRYMDWVGTQT
jgi:hypothetical protein